jgi:hypothetical protein
MGLPAGFYFVMSNDRGWPGRCQPGAGEAHFLEEITHKALENGRDLLLANLRAHFSGEPVLTPVEL